VLVFFVSDFVRKFLEMKMLHILGKLSYCAFLVHIFIIQMMFGYERQPLYIKNWTFVSF
jgi:peptidoglycan/LPS O-acetylase OafA/YrhL